MEELFEISIPTDNDGYVLLQCEHCGEFFKIHVSDWQNDEVLKIVCPACGLSSENFLTEDVVQLALAKVTNHAMDAIYEAFKDLEKHNRKGHISFSAGNRPRHETENPIHAGIQALEIAHFDCCNRTVKIKPLLKNSGCKCPLCGVMNYDLE